MSLTKEAAVELFTGDQLSDFELQLLATVVNQAVENRKLKAEVDLSMAKVETLCAALDRAGKFDVSFLDVARRHRAGGRR